MKHVFLTSLTLTLCGCAHMLNGDIQPIYINTNDSKKVKAIVENDKTKSTYILPATIKIPKSKSSLTITTINTECITSTKTSAKSSIDPITYANIFNFGLGFIKDYDGAMWHYKDAYTIDVKRDNSCIQKAKSANAEIANLHGAF